MRRSPTSEPHVSPQASRAAAPRDGVWEVPAELDGRPLDGVLRALLEVPWAEARRLIESGKVLVSKVSATATAPATVTETNGRRPMKAGQRVEVRLRAPRPETSRRRQVEDELIVHVDPAIVVVNKPAGLSTVPFGDEPPGEVTLDALVRDVLARQDRIRGRAPLGVVQRLDKGTSGLLVFARTVAAKKHLGQQLRQHSMYRRYLAIAHGVVRGGTIRSYLVEDRGDGLRGSARPGAREGQLAVTHVEALEVLSGGATLVACRLETGRTHQIRIHLAEAGHPLVGEAVYVRDHRGPRIPAPRTMLHAAELGLEHPGDGRELRFQVGPPEDFLEVLERLRAATSGSAPAPR